MTALSARGIDVRFGGVHAVNVVDLDLADGRLVGLIGPNGAGKTSFIDAITGFVASTGQLTLDGVALDHLSPHGRARAGLARTWQSVELFDDLTVLENLSVSASRPSVWSSLAETFLGRTGSVPAIREALCSVGIEDLADAEPATLSHGQRKLVGVARALAGSPTVLCLDEPAAGLDTRESLDLGRRLRAVADAGTAVLLVDHDMGLVLGICDEIVVLEFGRVIARGTPGEIQRDPAVVAAYLGAATTEPQSVGVHSIQEAKR